jgi:hypothetical protein
MRSQVVVVVSVPFTFYRFLIIGMAALVVLAPISLVFYQSFLTAPFFLALPPIALSSPIRISGRRSAPR